MVVALAAWLLLIFTVTTLKNGSSYNSTNSFANNWEKEELHDIDSLLKQIQHAKQLVVCGSKLIISRIIEKNCDCDQNSGGLAKLSAAHGGRGSGVNRPVCDSLAGQ